MMGEQCWGSVDSNRLPTMKPESDSQTGVTCGLSLFSGFLLCSERSGAGLKTPLLGCALPLKIRMQPFTSLMVSQSACLYPRDFWIRLVEPVFHIPWDFFSFFHIFFKNEDFIVKVFHLYLFPFLRTNNFHGQIFVNPSYMIQFLIRTCTILLFLRLKFLISLRACYIC